MTGWEKLGERTVNGKTNVPDNGNAQIELGAK